MGIDQSNRGHGHQLNKPLKGLAKIPEPVPMTSYKGSLRIAATHDVIESEFVVDEDQLEVIAGGERLGSWPLSELSYENAGSQVQMELDGEAVVLIVPNHDAFVEAIAPQKRRKKRRPKRAKRERTRTRLDMLDTMRKLTSRDTWRNWLSQRVVKWAVASFAVIVVALLALFATNSLGMILVLLGMVALVVAALAVSEDLTAYAWIPGELSESTLIIAGTIAMAIGGILILLG